MTDTVFPYYSTKLNNRAIALLIGFCLTAIITYLFFFGIKHRVIIPVNHIIPVDGFSYWVDLNQLGRPELHSQADTLNKPKASSLIVLENGKKIGLSHSIHEDIRRIGKGYFSHWGNGVYLSTSDNTDPRKNNRNYSLEYRTYPGKVFIYITTVLVLIVLVLNHRLLKNIYRRILMNDTIFVTVITVASMFMILAFLEIGFRYFTPFKSKQWPIQFYPGIGFHFKPNSTIKHTNHLDFWVTDKSNSWGFLDKEPSIPTSNTCHISFIGDSFVEAAQVEQPYKVQRLLEKWAHNIHPNWKLSTSAFGYSGTGQLNQLPFYDHYTRLLAPKMVVLVFVSNDFANNSGILEAIRNGWHPDAAPRVFANKVDNESYELTRIDTDWQLKRLSPLTPTTSDYSIHLKLKNFSYLYRWVWLNLSLQFPALNSLERPTHTEKILNYAHQLSQDPSISKRLTGWQDRYAENLDSQIHEPHLSLIYRDAVDATKFALQEFKRLTSKDGAQLILIATSQLKTSAGPKNKSFLASQRLEKITRELGIPLIDQYNFIKKQHGNPLDAQFKHDAHWTKQGHRWAAEAIMGYLEKNTSVCERN